MAIDMSILRVEPQMLNNAAESFQNSGNRIATETNEMMELVTSLANIWQSEAANAYITKFQGLSDDITRMLAMVSEHAADLQEIAANYMAAENQAVSEAESLSGDVIV